MSKDGLKHLERYEAVVKEQAAKMVDAERRMAEAYEVVRKIDPDRADELLYESDDLAIAIVHQYQLNERVK